MEKIDLFKMVEELENKYIKEAMAQAKTIGGAATLLTMNRTTLREKLRRKGMIEGSRQSVIEDPDGEFVAMPEDGKWRIEFKGEFLTYKRTIPEVNAFIKEKME